MCPINAIQAMPQGGDLKVSMEDGDRTVKVMVKDSGSGIADENLEKVLEPLFTTKGSEGSGLGLAICKEIVEIEHQGKFSIANHPKGGVQVEIQLPKMSEV